MFLGRSMVDICHLHPLHPHSEKFVVLGERIIPAEYFGGLSVKGLCPSSARTMLDALRILKLSIMAKEGRNVSLIILFGPQFPHLYVSFKIQQTLHRRQHYFFLYNSNIIYIKKKKTSPWYHPVFIPHSNFANFPKSIFYIFPQFKILVVFVFSF